MKIYPMTNITIIAVNMLKILAFTLACTFIVPEVFIHFFCNFCLRAIILLKKCVYLHKIRVDETVCYMSIVFVYSCVELEHNGELFWPGEFGCRKEDCL